ncbi:ATP-binding protein [Methanobrevibacter filiformis]|uniref:Cell division control protein 6 n=1 Tax=Methanobrevibacter filiformis TaxID=55758 RepID=A0A166C3T6_9EURY|nr:ATP-binding protein [Methanobrevibacter filiformis]KZX14100.1 cell division control protein 6 [Methanobrevibacter filiformis]
MQLLDKISPFQPQDPVDPEKFEGRKEVIETYLPYFNQASQGRPLHFFITGKRGMGKTSLASYFKDMAERKYKMVGVHIFNDGIHDIDSVIHQIVERLLNEIVKEKWSKKIIDGFKKHVKSVGFAGANLELNNDKETINHIKDNFAFVLEDIISKFEDKNGLLIIIDDINGLSDDTKFSNWYKSFADTLSTRFGGNIPLAMILAGYPEKLEKLHQHNPSFTRIFKHIEVEKLTDYEIREFFIKNFQISNIKIEKSALDIMVHFSSGLPNMMQEIGDGVFWINNNKTVNYRDALNGIIRAGNEIGFKYLKPDLDSSIRSDKYLAIFKKLGRDFFGQDLGKDYSFRKKDFISLLDTKEAKVFSDFLIKARDLKIIEFKGAKRSDHYAFTNNLYLIYFLIKILEQESEK